MLRTELRTLAEYLLDLFVVLHIPVYLGLHHQHRNVLLQGVIIIFKRLLNGLRVTCYAGILDCFSVLSKLINMLVSEHLELGIGILFGCLRENKSIDELELFRRDTLVSELSILSKDVSG